VPVCSFLGDVLIACTGAASTTRFNELLFFLRITRAPDSEDGRSRKVCKDIVTWVSVDFSADASGGQMAKNWHKSISEGSPNKSGFGARQHTCKLGVGIQ
jgi:hypothetical protein